MILLRKVLISKPNRCHCMMWPSMNDGGNLLSIMDSRGTEWKNVDNVASLFKLHATGADRFFKETCKP